MTGIDLEAIRARADAATPGPWGWYGNTDTHDVYLATQKWGRHYVMEFERWGMQQAQPVFVEGRSWVADGDSLKFHTSGGMFPAAELARYEVAPDATDRKDPRVYRADLTGFRNPDATFIAAARQDIADLLAEVDRLRAALVNAEDVAERLSLRLAESRSGGGR